MYKVIYKFYDIEDKNKHVYNVGEIFPYDGRKISKNRIEELSSEKNKIGKPLIEFINDNSDTIVDNSNDNDKLDTNNDDLILPKKDENNNVNNTNSKK